MVQTAFNGLPGIDLLLDNYITKYQLFIVIKIKNTPLWGEVRHVTYCKWGDNCSTGVLLHAHVPDGSVELRVVVVREAVVEVSLERFLELRQLFPGDSRGRCPRIGERHVEHQLLAACAQMLDAVPPLGQLGEVAAAADRIGFHLDGVLGEVCQ